MSDVLSGREGGIAEVIPPCFTNKLTPVLCTSFTAIIYQGKHILIEPENDGRFRILFWQSGTAALAGGGHPTSATHPPIRCQKRWEGTSPLRHGEHCTAVNLKLGQHQKPLSTWGMQYKPNYPRVYDTHLVIHNTATQPSRHTCSKHLQ